MVNQLDTNGNPAIGATIFNGVLQQVIENLPQLIFIALNEIFTAFIAQKGDVDLL